MEVKPNESVLGYQFLQRIGEGPTGAVWLVRETAGAVEFAIKLVKTEVFPPSSIEVIYEKLSSAVARAGRLTHPHLAWTRTPFHEPKRGLYGLVSEHIEGQSLARIQIPRGPDGLPGAGDARTLAGVLAWFQQLAAVLAWLHTNGVVHGGVKPSNVILTTGYERPSIKLLDLCWSIATLKTSAVDDRFLSPEQSAGGQALPASDQWAVSMLLRELLVTSAQGAVESQALALAPPKLVRVLERGLERDPRKRFADMGALFYALESVKNEIDQLPDIMSAPTELDLDPEGVLAREVRGRERSAHRRQRRDRDPGPSAAPEPDPGPDPAATDAFEPLDIEPLDIEPLDIEPSRRKPMLGILGGVALILAAGLFLGRGFLRETPAASIPPPPHASDAAPPASSDTPPLPPSEAAPPARAEPLPTETAPGVRGGGDLASESAKGSKGDAAAAYARACDLGRLDACTKAADLFEHARGPEGGKQARRFYEKACDRRVATACSELSRLYRSGIGGPVNDRVAEAFGARACAFGLKDSCK